MPLMRSSFFRTAVAVAVAAAGAMTASVIGFFFLPDETINQPASQAGSSQIITQLVPRTKTLNFEPPKVGTYKLPIIKPAGDGEIIGIDGKVSHLAQHMKGRIIILSFIHTHCRDEKGCPLARATLFDAHNASKHMPHIAKNAKFISLSFDPVRDTPDIIKSYANPVLGDPEAKQKVPWSFFTTKSEVQLKPILTAYGQVIGPSFDPEVISHVLRLYLIDRKGRVRNIYGLDSLDPRLMFADIEALLMEEKEGCKRRNRQLGSKGPRVKLTTPSKPRAPAQN